MSDTNKDTKTTDPNLALCASLTIAGVNDMGDDTAKEVVKWLTKINRILRSAKKREEYSNKCTFRYYVKLPPRVSNTECRQEHKP